MRHEAAQAGEAAQQPFFSLPSAARAGGRRSGGAPPSAGKADARLADHADGGAGQATASVTSCVTMDAASWQRAISASSKRCIWPLKACPCSGGMGQKPAGGPCRPLADSEQFFSWPRHKKSLPSVLGRLLWPRRAKPKRKSSGVWRRSPRKWRLVASCRGLRLARPWPRCPRSGSGLAALFGGWLISRWRWRLVFAFTACRRHNHRDQHGIALAMQYGLDALG